METTQPPSESRLRTVAPAISVSIGVFNAALSKQETWPKGIVVGLGTAAIVGVILRLIKFR
jgi:hypothetical protein